MAEVNIEQVRLQSLKEAIDEAIFAGARSRRELGLLKREQERLKAILAKRRIQLTSLRNKIIKEYNAKINSERLGAGKDGSGRDRKIRKMAKCGLTNKYLTSVLQFIEKG